jgi:hypothetical protein
MVTRQERSSRAATAVPFAEERVVRGAVASSLREACPLRAATWISARRVRRSQSATARSLAQDARRAGTTRSSLAGLTVLRARLYSSHAVAGRSPCDETGLRDARPSWLAWASLLRGGARTATRKERSSRAATAIPFAEERVVRSAMASFLREACSLRAAPWTSARRLRRSQDALTLRLADDSGTAGWTRSSLGRTAYLVH